MRCYTEAAHTINATDHEEVKIPLATNLLSLGLVGLAMVILWVLLFGF